MVEKKHVLRKSINFCGKTKGLFYLVNSFLIWDAKKQPHNEVNPLLGKIYLVVYSHQRRYPYYLFISCLSIPPMPYPLLPMLRGMGLFHPAIHLAIGKLGAQEVAFLQLGRTAHCLPVMTGNGKTPFEQGIYVDEFSGLL